MDIEKKTKYYVKNLKITACVIHAHPARVLQVSVILSPDDNKQTSGAATFDTRMACKNSPKKSRATDDDII